MKPRYLQLSIIGIVLFLLVGLFPVPASAASLTVSPNKMELFVGQSKKASAKVSGVKNPVYVWTTSNSKVATVKGGTITAKAVGKATITVTVQKTKLKSTIQVSVKRKKLDAQAAFKAVNPSVATVEMYDASNRKTATGSGFVTKKGEVITNFHVVSGENNHCARIRFANGLEVETTKLKRFDDESDLAILDVPLLQSIPTLPTAKTGGTGSVVYALGSPQGVNNTITQGILSNREVYFNGRAYLQFNASVTNGNSGGPLVDEFGQVIGIVTWGFTDSQNMNYAVPIQELSAMRYGRETIANVQAPTNSGSVLPVVSGKGDTREQELNDSFADADVISYASGDLIGSVYDQEDLDTFVFRIDKQMTLSVIGWWVNNLQGEHWAFGVFDANGDAIQYSEEYLYEDLYYETLELELPAGEYYIASFPMPGLDASEYLQQSYRMSYELK